MPINNKLPIAVLIATRNEEKNIEKCLKSLQPAKEIHVIDSNSLDATISIAKAYGATTHTFEYKGGYPKKRQWALENVETAQPWILLLDADEEVPEQLWQEISNAISPSKGNHYSAYMITKGFWFLGRQFNFGGFSHSAILLIQKGKGKFENLNDSIDTGLDMEVHERVLVDGEIGHLNTPLIHNDFKGLSHYLEKHNQYATWEADVRYSYKKGRKWGDKSISPKLFGNVQERRRFLKQVAVNLPVEPLAWFVYHYFLRLGCLEGRRGLIASLIRAQYISNIRAKLYEKELLDKTTQS